MRLLYFSPDFMRTTQLLSLVLIAAFGGFAGCASPTPATEKTAAPATPTKSPATAAEMPFPKLEKGTSAAVIREKLGTPAEVQPMPSPEGKAEVWIYKYTQAAGMAQVAAGTRDTQVMATPTPGAGLITVKEPVYTMVPKTAHITLSLLMFNDLLQVQKAAVEETVDYH